MFRMLGATHVSHTRGVRRTGEQGYRRFLRGIRRAHITALTTFVILAGCHDSKSVSLTVPEPAARGLNRDDSIAVGYLRPDGSVATSLSLSAITACSSDCVELVSADPGLFQGYTQPNSITLTLAGRVGTVTVVGQGSIQCSGSYGDLIGYDSTGAEIGRTSLQLIDPADCSPDWNPDNVTYGAQATLITSVPVARAVITSMSPLEFTVRGNCCGRASATYSVSLAAIPLPEISLTCTGPFPRGDEITCTASAPDPAQQLTVTGWSFTSDTGDVVDRSVTPESPTWKGRLVTAGDVVVKGTLNGTLAESKPRHVTVIARDWTAKLPRRDHQLVVPSQLKSRPDSLPDLGGTNGILLVDSSATYLVTIQDNGPNHDFVFLNDLKGVVIRHVQM